jgi:hypothetical protein
MKFRRALVTLSLASLVCLAAVPAGAQEAVSKETAAAVKASFIYDLDNLHTKFVGLANAFPQDKYTWRPMEGVRSVSEVLMLAAFEGYNFIPTSFGAKGADLGPDAAKLRTLTDKAQIIEHLDKGFAYAKSQLEALDPATLTARRKLMISPNPLAVTDIALGIGGDLHEHLGQMIAYARMNHIVPPWSK